MKWFGVIGQRRGQIDLRKNTKDVYHLNPVITLPSYKNENGFLYRYLNRYENIILMMDINTYKCQTVVSLIFYDTHKSKIVTLPDWAAYEKSSRIFEIYPVKSCIFSLALLDEKCILSCFEMKYHTWQKCYIPVEWSCNHFSNPRIRMEYDGTTLYVGILNTKTELWKYFKIIRTKTKLYLEPLSFLRGDLTLFHSIQSSQNEIVFRASGNSIEIQNMHEKMFQKVNAHDAIIRYNYSGFDVIASNSEYFSLEYDALIDNCIYYEIIEESKSILLKYDLALANNYVVPINQEQSIALSSGKDLYIYSDTAFQRISDGKIFSIDAIMHAFQKLNVPLINEIDPFPSMCFFHDHWLEIEISDFRFFLIHLDTMHPYFFEGMIDVDGNYLYRYE